MSMSPTIAFLAVFQQIVFKSLCKKAYKTGEKRTYL